MPPSPSLTVIYSIPGRVDKTQVFDSSNVAPARLGVKEGTTATKPTAGDFSYSGMHDQGPLPPPREGGSMATLIGCIQAAKELNDNYLTEVIHQENEVRDHPSKRTKHDG